MALILSVNCKYFHEPIYFNNADSKPNPSQFSGRFQKHRSSFTVRFKLWEERRRFRVVNCSGEDSGQPGAEEDEEASVGVKAALSVLRFYKREISPLLLNSCRYVPTCSEYSMIAYKKYGVAKGTVLTAWRLCRCNPLGGSGFDPPRWFDEATPPEQ
ncbi:UPF0161 protein At3g09310-like isoform X1 [Primulina tabacum]|uniref:UPF0161 protein At3g09310-like isoform X1 n=1 Tax=Primulina tabacum TaxID=48773 RepID=UPI003F5A2484